MPKCTERTIQVGRLARRVVEANFECGDISTDGGVLVLPRVDERIRLSRATEGALSDPRDPARITGRFIPANLALDECRSEAPTALPACYLRGDSGVGQAQRSGTVSRRDNPRTRGTLRIRATA
jgi:hypothetical protein